MNETADSLPSVLVIEDEIQIRRLLKGYLERNGFEVIEAASGETGLTQVLTRQPQAILLDLRLPDMEGLEVLKRLREWNQIPVIVISVRNREVDKIAALNGGANDYLTKPFGTGELLARLRVVLRPVQPLVKMEVFRSGPLSVDLPTRTVSVSGKAVRLTATEYALLILFVKHAGKVLTHSQILRDIWGEGALDGPSVVRVYVRYLRKKLEADPVKPELLITEPGVGYRLIFRD